MTEGPLNPYRELRESELRSEIIRVLNRAAEFEGLKAAGDAQSMVQDYLYSAQERRFALERNILELLDRIDLELFYMRDTAPVQSLKSDGSLLARLIRTQQELRGSESYEPSAAVTVSVPRDLIDRLRSEADYMEENSLGVVPGPLADVLRLFEGAVKTQTVDTVREFGFNREGSIYRASSRRRGHSERAPMSDKHEAPAGDSKAQDSQRGEEKIPVIEGMLVRGAPSNFDVAEDFLWAVHTVEKGVVELDGVSHPGIGAMVNLEDFWSSFSFAVDVVQPGPVLDAIRELAAQERRERNAQLRGEITDQLSASASKVVEGVGKLSERYGPVGERFLKRAVSAAKNAVESVSVKVEETNAPEGGQESPKASQAQSEDDQVLNEAFSQEGFENASDREVDLQALREKLASSPKVRPAEAEAWDAPRDRVAQLIYDAQHPDNGSKWLTTVDGSPNVASYAAADALLSEFSGFIASSNGGKISGTQADAEHNREDRAADGKLEGPTLEDFPVPMPPAESDLDRLAYLQRALDLDDFESSFRRDDTLTELLDLLPNAIAEIAYLRDNEGEIQQGFAESLKQVQESVDTSSVRRAWEAFREAIDSRDAIYESRQEERSKVRELEAEIESLKASRGKKDEDSRTAAEKIAGWTEEANRREDEAINRASVISYNRWADSQKELGHVETFLLSGVLMDVKLLGQEGTSLKLLELTPKDADKPLFRREICAAGFLSEEKLRKIVQDPEGWIGDKKDATDE